MVSGRLPSSLSSVTASVDVSPVSRSVTSIVPTAAAQSRRRSGRPAAPRRCAAASAARIRPAPRARCRSGRRRSRRSRSSSCRAPAHARSVPGPGAERFAVLRSAPARSNSTPPPTAICMPSSMISLAAVAIAIRPEAHCRSSDMPATLSGRPARKARSGAPTLKPCRALLHRRADDHVVDLGRIDAGALHRLGDGVARPAPAAGCR